MPLHETMVPIHGFTMGKGRGAISVTPENTLRDYQHSQLCRAAVSTGRLKDLLYYYGALRDEKALHGLVPRLEGGHPEDRLLYHLLSGGIDPANPAALTSRGEGIEDPWILYTLAKYLLARDQITAAIAVVVSWMKRGGPGTSVLNLIVRYAAHKGEYEVAHRVAALSLQKAPGQNDMARFVASLAAGGPQESPQLDVMPPRWRVTYYLPCYNVEAYIAQTIEAVASLCHPLDEILIIDDGSPDRSIDIACTYPVRIIRHPSNRGLAAARNTAWQNTDADFIGTVDTDACPDPGYLKFALMEFEQGPPELALSGGRLIEAHTDTVPDVWRAVYLGQDPGKLRWYADALPKGAGETQKCAWDVSGNARSISGSDTVARRSALVAVGGYDPRHRTNAEDVTLCKVLLKAGYHYVFSPHCVALHYRRDTLASVFHTTWNYGYWQRKDSGCYESASTILALIDDHCVASQHFIMQSIEVKRTELLYLEFLYSFHSGLLELQHGVRLGHFSPGQALTVWRALEAVIVALDKRFGGELLVKIRGDVAHIALDDSVVPVALSDKDGAKLAENLAYLREDHGRYNQRFYELLLAR